MKLKALVSDPASRLGDEFFGHGAEFRGVGCARVQFPRGLAQEGPGGLKFDLHVGEAELQGLELVDALSERLALAHISKRCRQGRLCRPQRAGRDIQPSAIKTGHGIGEALSFLTQQVLGRDGAAIHLDLTGRLRAPAHLVFQAAEGQARGAILDDIGRDALRPVFARPGHDDIGVRIAAARDEGLGAGQAPAFVRAVRPGSEGCGVRAGAWLRQAVGENGLHRHRSGKDPCLHLVRSEGVDHLGAHVVDRKEGCDRGACHRQRLEDQRRVQPREAGSASGIRHVKSAESQFPKLWPKVLGDRACLFPVARKRRDMFLAKGTGHVEDGLLLLA